MNVGGISVLALVVAVRQTQDSGRCAPGNALAGNILADMFLVSRWVYRDVLPLAGLLPLLSLLV